MTREETLSWAKSLKPGDAVIYKSGWSGWCGLSVLEVEKVTPAGWVKTTSGEIFSQKSWADEMRGRGSTSGYIVPITDEFLQEAQRQAAERAEEDRKDRIRAKAINKIWDEYNNRFNMSYDRAVKILEAFEKIDVKES